MTNLDQIVQRAREVLAIPQGLQGQTYSGTWEKDARELATAVVKMVEELEGVVREEEYVTRIEKANLTSQQRCQQLESQRDQLQNWLDNIAAAFLHKANPGFTYEPRTLGDEIMERIEELEARLTTARKLIQAASEMMTISVPEWDAGADQFMKETEGL